MFICERHLETTKSGEKAFTVIIEKRPREYQYVITKQIGAEKVEKNITSRGWEIAKELKVCKKCYNEFLANNE